MKQIVAVLSNDRPIYTPPRRPEGHGKIEAFNRLCRAAFVEEVRASSIRTLDDLNRAFNAWKDLKYNRRVHGETGQTPWDRWRARVSRLVHMHLRCRCPLWWMEPQHPCATAVERSRVQA